MSQGRARPHATQIALAGHVRPGDHVLREDRYIEIVRVRRARGRKPSRGENLHLLGTDETIKINSLEGVRIRARA